MLTRRTDLALEAHELWQKAAGEGQTLTGLRSCRRSRFGLGVTEVELSGGEAQRALGKPAGRYLTLDLRDDLLRDPREVRRAARALAAELRALFPAPPQRALVVCLGSAAMTPDALGPLTASRLLATRHLADQPDFSGLAAVSVLCPGVLAQTGIESAEQVRGAVQCVQPQIVLAVDALASRRPGRVCTTVQLSNTGIVPGSGVGNHRSALTRQTLGVPVFAVGVPTVVDAATLALDVLERAGLPAPEDLPDAEPLMVTPRDIDARVAVLARVLGLGIGLALLPRLTAAQLEQLVN